MTGSLGIGTQINRLAFPQLFQVLPNFHECFNNSTENWRICFLFLLENTMTKNENNLLPWVIDENILTMSTACAGLVFLSSVGRILLD